MFLILWILGLLSSMTKRDGLNVLSDPSRPYSPLSRPSILADPQTWADRPSFKYLAAARPQAHFLHSP